MNELREYQQRRLDLADMLRAVMHVARRYDDAEREREVRALLTRLAAGRFRLAVLGQFSRGKTTLMNALLGGAWLPMGALPMTSVITTVRYGSRPRALIRGRASSFGVEVPVTEVARYVARHSAERAHMEVASVEVELPAEFLRAGFEFVDTPGVGSANPASTAMTLRFLPQADAIVFVTGFDSPLTQAEADFLNAAARHAGKLFLVLNKRDLVSERDARDVAVFMRDWARDHLGLAEPHVFALSALTALEAAAQPGSQGLADSGIGPLADTLSQFLGTEQGRVSLRNVAAAAADLVSRLQRDLHLGRRDLSRQDAASVATAFETRVGELLAAERAAAARVDSRVTAQLPSLLAGRGPAWRADLCELLIAAAEQETARDVAADADAVQRTSLESVARAGKEVTAHWLRQQTAEIGELLTAAVADEIGVLMRLARSPRGVGAAIAGLAGAGEDPPEGWSPEDIPALPMPGIDWAMPEVNPGRQARRRRGTTSDTDHGALAAALTASAADFAERVGAAFTHAARLWAEQLRVQAESHTDREAERVRYYLRAAPDAEDLAVLDELAGRFARYQRSLNTWAPAGSPRPPAAAAPAAHRAEHSGACVVCSRMQAVLTEYLSQHQFLLATRERDQERHAQAGGYCPLHTWQYADMASPLGVAAGYAKLADAMAAALESIQRGAGAGPDLTRQVAGLAAGRACRVCDALATCERTWVASVSHAPPDAGTGPLCLRHLALVLADGPPAESGHVLVSSLATALRRASADMRAYALKREALRRDQVTGEEASAHADALSLLAGQPALVLPRGNAARRPRVSPGGSRPPANHHDQWDRR